MNGKSTGDLREMLEQHIPSLKPFLHRNFASFTGYVDEIGQSSLIIIHAVISNTPMKFPPLFLANFQRIPYLCP